MKLNENFPNDSASQKIPIQLPALHDAFTQVNFDLGYKRKPQTHVERCPLEKEEYLRRKETLLRIGKREMATQTEPFRESKIFSQKLHELNERIRLRLQ